MNKPTLGRLQSYPVFSHRVYCSYTNDPARRLETCQAAGEAKNRHCRIKNHLPRPVVYKAGNARHRGQGGLHVCIETLSSQAVWRDLCSATGNALGSEITMRLTVNGRVHDVDAAPDTALLYVLRNDLALNGPKYGCGLGECGACAVLIDGVAARSCAIPIQGCAGRGLATLAGLSSREHPDPVQAAFIEEQAAQCGYCLNAMIISTKG